MPNNATEGAVKEPPKTREAVFELAKSKLKEIGAEGDIVLGANLQEDLALDSLDAVEMVMEFEDLCEIKISDEDAKALTTVGELVDYLCGRLEIAE